MNSDQADFLKLTQVPLKLTLLSSDGLISASAL